MAYDCGACKDFCTGIVPAQPIGSRFVVPRRSPRSSSLTSGVSTVRLVGGVRGHERHLGGGGEGVHLGCGEGGRVPGLRRHHQVGAELDTDESLYPDEAGNQSRSASEVSSMNSGPTAAPGRQEAV